MIESINATMYAQRLGIDLYKEYNAEEAAKLCRVGVNALRKAKNDGELGYISLGEKRCRFLGVDLIKWKLNKRITGSGNITSLETGKGITAERGTTKTPDSASQQAYALKLLK